jgi:hypothetical protein
VSRSARGHGWLLLPVAAAVGVTTGIASLGLHDKSWAWWLLAVGAPYAAAVAAPAGWVRAGFGLGWTGLVLVALLGRPEGDYVVAATARGYALLVAALVLGVYAIVTLPVQRRAAGESGSSAHVS